MLAIIKRLTGWGGWIADEPIFAASFSVGVKQQAAELAVCKSKQSISLLCGYLEEYENICVNEYAILSLFFSVGVIYNSKFFIMLQQTLDLSELFQEIDHSKDLTIPRD